MLDAPIEPRSSPAAVLSRRLVLNEHVATLAPPFGNQRARGLLVIGGGFGARIGADRNRTELLWPASLREVQAAIDTLTAWEAAERQTWLDWDPAVHGTSPTEALFAPASMLVWYLEFEVLEALGVRGGRVAPRPDDPTWNQLLDDVASTIPPAVHWLDRPSEETARLLVHSILNAEIAGNSQGKCFLRICSNQSASAAPSGGSCPTASAGVTS